MPSHPSEVYTLTRGKAALLISMPHVGTVLAPGMAARLQPHALQLADTDWHLPLLYDFCQQLEATCIVARYSRYVIDLNRPPDNANLYPGQNTTGLCPIDDFASQPLYRAGLAPSAAEVQERRSHYWQPYHDCLQQELQRLRAQHAQVLLWDAHSIASLVPRFFSERLPSLNLGTADGASCAPALANTLLQLAADSGYSHVLNGRFKGGYITRHYGQPALGLHAVQMEMTRACYMTEDAPWAWDAKRAAPVRPLLERMLRACLAFCQA